MEPNRVNKEPSAARSAPRTAAPSARAARRKLRDRVFRAILLLAAIAALLLVTLLGSVLVGRWSDGGREDETDRKDGQESGSESTGESESENPYAGYTVVATPSSKTACGTLILVNGEYVYDFTENDQTFIGFGEVRKKIDGVNPYQLLSLNLSMEKTALDAMNQMLCDFYTQTGNRYVLVSSAHRTKAEQDATGSSIKGGYSDSHTGYSAALKVYQDGVTLELRGAAYDWLYENAHQYGFVTRYPADKVTVTGVSDYTNYFRYVGYPAACYMSENGLCLEEFLELARRFTFQGEHLAFTAADGTSYELYYVPASSGTTTEIPVPLDRDYALSGDNAGGFVVIAKK